MRIRRFELLAVLLSLVLIPSFVSVQQAQAQSLDIVGIKPGMPMQDAMQALKADNPKLKVNSTTFKYEGFNDPLTLEVDAEDVAPTLNAGLTQPSERLELSLATSAGQTTVWGIYRDYTFAASQKPSMQTTLDALRKKYGQETVPGGPVITAQTLVWIYDAQGKLMGSGSARLNGTCAGTLQNYIGGGASTAENADLAAPTPRQWPPDCTSITVVSATITGVQIAPNQYAVSDLLVKLQDGGRYRKALDATRSVIAAAVKARQDGQVNQTNKVAAPKL